MTPQEQAYEVWQEFGKSEPRMLAILAQLIATIEEQKEKMLDILAQVISMIEENKEKGTEQ
jgi:hypothetical protein